MATNYHHDGRINWAKHKEWNKKLLNNKGRHYKRVFQRIRNSVTAMRYQLGCRGIDQSMMESDTCLSEKGVIYCVIHIPSGKFYIGQTINSAWERFIQHWRISRKEGGRDYKRVQFHRIMFQSPLHNFRVFGPWKKLTRICI